MNLVNESNPKLLMEKNGTPLSRDDFDGGPVSLDEIEKGIWIGNVTAATDMDVLKHRDINYILTVDSCPLPSFITQISALKTKYIHVSDIVKEDLLNQLTECIEFIEEAQDMCQRILVHCYFGVSRSAAVVIAYIMKKYKLSYTPAFERVKSKRRFVGPNPGFVQQLRLFHKMGWKIDRNDDNYKLYCLRIAADKVRKAKILPQNCMNLVKPDPASIQTNPDPIVYRCRKCRRIIATKNNFIIHYKKQINDIFINKNDDGLSIDSENEICSSNNENGGDNNVAVTATAADNTVKIDRISHQLKTNSLDSADRSIEANKHINEQCKEIYFIEPLLWMEGILKHTEGKLHCPKCRSKLGNFNWTMGCYCPCGRQISPAFYLVPSKVELSHTVQNVQITV